MANFFYVFQNIYLGYLPHFQEKITLCNSKINTQKLVLHWNSICLSWEGKNIYFSVLILSVEPYSVYRTAKWLKQPQTVYSTEIY